MAAYLTPFRTPSHIRGFKEDAFPPLKSLFKQALTFWLFFVYHAGMTKRSIPTHNACPEIVKLFEITVGRMFGGQWAALLNAHTKRSMSSLLFVPPTLHDASKWIFPTYEFPFLSSRTSTLSVACFPCFRPASKPVRYLCC
jgi:hypothetical protein